jgi:hypothetical protein
VAEFLLKWFQSSDNSTIRFFAATFLFAGRHRDFAMEIVAQNKDRPCTLVHAGLSPRTRLAPPSYPNMLGTQ